ncbi:MAG: inositol monophosphatase family protein [Parvularculaceae bacterium]
MTADASQYSEFSLFAGRLADAARVETLPRFRAGSAVVNKAGIWFDPVTDADREAERVVRRMISAVYPKHGIIGEEFGAERAEAEYRWVIDPVDGTRAFVCGVSTWATLIGLECDGRPALGLIDQPFTDERWVGSLSGARYRRGGEERVCKTSGVTELKRARLSTTDPRREAYFTSEEAAAFAAVAAKSQVARFSLDAYAYGLLAIGELDLVVESSLKHHDYCALVAVVEGAGGVITGWKGEPLGECARGRIVASATKDLHEAALDLLKAI